MAEPLLDGANVNPCAEPAGGSEVRQTVVHRLTSALRGIWRYFVSVTNGIPQKIWLQHPTCL
jgi:hypothetical protein